MMKHLLGDPARRRIELLVDPGVGLQGDGAVGSPASATLRAGQPPGRFEQILLEHAELVGSRRRCHRSRQRRCDRRAEQRTRPLDDPAVYRPPAQRADRQAGDRAQQRRIDRRGAERHRSQDGAAVRPRCGRPRQQAACLPHEARNRPRVAGIVIERTPDRREIRGARRVETLEILGPERGQLELFDRRRERLLPAWRPQRLCAVAIERRVRAKPRANPERSPLLLAEPVGDPARLEHRARRGSGGEETCTCQRMRRTRYQVAAQRMSVRFVRHEHGAHRQTALDGEPGHRVGPRTKSADHHDHVCVLAGPGARPDWITAHLRPATELAPPRHESSPLSTIPARIGARADTCCKL